MNGKPLPWYHPTKRPRGGRPLTREDAGEFPVPVAFGPYRVLHQVGVGVLGPVYRARESDDDRTVAIKSFHLDLTPEQVDVFAGALADIVNMEASHPALIAPLAAGLESGTPFMAYEYVEAESLDVVLRSETRPAEGLAWIASLADAVDAAHAFGLVHGALHLRDVLVVSEGLCVTGFGIARALEQVQLGFPVRRPYTAPEVIGGDRWGPPADRFAVAVLAYEILTGTRPSATGDAALGDLVDLRPDVADPAGLQQAFRNALAEDPGIRSPSAAGFVTALTRAIGDEAGRTRPGSAPDRPGGVQVGEDGQGDHGPALDSPRAPDTDGSAGGAGGRMPPPVQIALPDTVGVLDDQDVDSGTAGDVAAASNRPARPPRSGRRPPYRSGAPRRSGPVVAVREEVQWDPPDAPRAAQSSAARPAYGDDDVPPPPSPTSMRTLAAMVAAGIGAAAAGLIFTGLTTSGDEDVGAANPSSEDAGAGVEWSEQTVAGSGSEPAGALPGGAAEAPASRGPQTLVAEPVVAVGDPPAVGGAAPRAVDSEQSPPAARVGSLYVDSRPPGASVSVDGVVVGVAPLEVSDVDFGEHRVRIEMPGYRPWVSEVDVSGADRVRVGARLTPEGRR